MAGGGAYPLSVQPQRAVSGTYPLSVPP
jgi:hypothetical protein